MDLPLSCVLFTVSPVQRKGSNPFGKKEQEKVLKLMNAALYQFLPYCQMLDDKNLNYVMHSCELADF